MLAQAISAFKWWLILHGSGINCSFFKTIIAYFVGMFVNILGIGTIGGDTARALLVSSNGSLTAKTVVSVFIDRAHGLAVLSAIGAGSAAWFGHNRLPPIILSGVVLLGSVIVATWITLLLIPSNLRSIVLSPFGKFGTQVSSAFEVIPRNPWLLAAITVVSGTFHFIQIALHGYMAYILNIKLPWSALFVGVPFTNIASTLPFSWQGLGVRENAYQFFLVPDYITSSDAIAFGAMWIFASTVSGITGGIIAFITNARSIIMKR
jgi:uncharacterized membrane protein YbhN (UPF0104 family)